MNFSVFLEKKYGEHLGITDDEYKIEGAILYDSVKEILEKYDVDQATFEKDFYDFKSALKQYNLLDDE